MREEVLHERNHEVTVQDRRRRQAPRSCRGQAARSGAGAVAAQDAAARARRGGPRCRGRRDSGLGVTGRRARGPSVGPLTAACVVSLKLLLAGSLDSFKLRDRVESAALLAEALDTAIAQDPGGLHAYKLLSDPVGPPCMHGAVVRPRRAHSDTIATASPAALCAVVSRARVLPTGVARTRGASHWDQRAKQSIMPTTSGACMPLALKAGPRACEWTPVPGLGDASRTKLWQGCKDALHLLNVLFDIPL